MAFNRLNPKNYKFFGYRIPQSEQRENKLNKEIFDLQIIQPDIETGSVITDNTEYMSTTVDIESIIKKQRMYIEKYRAMEKDPIIDFAVNEICNDVLNVDSEDDVIEIDLSSVTEISDQIKETIVKEWEVLHDLFKLNEMGYERIRRYYVDGAAYYHVVVNTKRMREGIKGIIPLDPRYIKRVIEIKRKNERDDSQNADVIESKEEYFIYSTEAQDTNQGGFLQTYGRQLKLSPEMVVYCNSGVFGSGQDSGIVYSHLETCRKPLNVMSQLEASLLIFRLTRAPNRLMFSIDVGGLPSKAAQAEVSKYAREYRTVVNYDEDSGELTTNGQKLAITDNYFLPQREGRGTSIDTLDGNTDFLKDLEDLSHFDKKLKRATHVPLSRFDTEPAMLGSRIAEITREEWRFQKFIHRIRKRYMNVFKELIKKQLILKRIITLEDWSEKISPHIQFIYKSDSILLELREAELLGEKFNMVAQTEEIVGKYVSHEWVRRKVLGQSDEDIQEEDKKIKAETNNAQFNKPVEEGF